MAILSTEDFDAVRVDESSVTLGTNGVIKHTAAHFEDVNFDGRADLVLHFETQDTGIACGDTEVMLTGLTNDDRMPLEGSDSIVTVGCENESKKGQSKKGK